MSASRYPDLRGKRVFVSAASAGIGKATALAFDAQGAEVTIVARHKDRLEAVAACMHKGHVVVADLSDTAQCERAVAEAVEAMGGLDVLANVGPPGESGELGEAFKLHVINVHAMCMAAKPELVKNRGAIVNVSTAASENAAHADYLIPYACAKTAQDMLTRSLARQWASDGIRVNAILPGVTKTEAIDRMATSVFGMESGEQLAAAVGPHLHALGRCAEPEEMASAIVFLASQAASFITGACVPVDGGFLLLGTAPPKPAPEGQ